MPVEPVDTPLFLRPPFNSIQGGSDPRYAMQSGTCVPNIPFPKRPGDPTDASSNKEARASQDPEETTGDVNLEDFG